jgi:purine-nucleoside phosphorylase
MLENRINESVKYLEGIMSEKPVIGMILGSGLGDLAEEIEDKVYIEYSTIPNFPVSTVEGHKGRFVYGKLFGKTVVAMQGRFHFYEGYEMSEVTFPVRVLKKLGVDTLIVTNAAGAVNKNYEPGQLMVISDHINLFGTNPLMGKNLSEFGVRFPDLSNAYDKELREKVKAIAIQLGINVQEGVYAGMTGPAYETPAEIRMLQVIGADAVGMSTVPEVIVANHAGMKVIGISCMTNMAAGILDQPLNHEEVIETSARVRGEFMSLVKETVKAI